MILFLFAFAFLSIDAQLQQINENREYLCGFNRKKSIKSECRLRFGAPEDELSAINDNGCFKHFDKNRNELIELCPLQCQRFESVKVLTGGDQSTIGCEIGRDAGVERRQHDWFLWRTTRCQQVQANFRFECESVRLHRADFEDEHDRIDSLENEQNVEEEEIVKSSAAPNDNRIGDMFASSIEETISEKRRMGNEKKLKKSEDELPKKIDTILAFMFPSYRKKI